MIVNSLTINPILQRVLDYATTNTITIPTGATLVALNTYCNALEASGILAHTGSGGVPISASDFTLLDVFANFSYNDTGLEDFALICWIRLVEMDIFGTTPHTINGFKGNASNVYIDTLFNPTADGNNYTQDNASFNMTVYAENVGGGNNSYLHGIDGNGSKDQTVNLNNTAQRINSLTLASSAIDFSGTGQLILSRDNSTTVRGINKGTEVSRTQAVGTLSNETFKILRRGGSTYGNAGVSDYFVGASINNTQAQAKRTAQNIYLDSIGLTQFA